MRYKKSKKRIIVRTRSTSNASRCKVTAFATLLQEKFTLLLQKLNFGEKEPSPIRQKVVDWGRLFLAIQSFWASLCLALRV